MPFIHVQLHILVFYTYIVYWMVNFMVEFTFSFWIKIRAKNAHFSSFNMTSNTLQNTCNLYVEKAIYNFIKERILRELWGFFVSADFLSGQLMKFWLGRCLNLNQITMEMYIVLHYWLLWYWICVCFFFLFHSSKYKYKCRKIRHCFCCMLNICFPGD